MDHVRKIQCFWIEWCSDEDTHNDIADHICNLYANIMKYFPNINDKNRIQNQFSIQEKPVSFCVMYCEHVIDISSDSQLGQTFQEISVITCWGDTSVILSTTRTCNSSADTLRQRTCAKLDCELRSNKSEIQKQTKCGSVCENLSFQY
jgi:hypothetical protein